MLWFQTFKFMLLFAHDTLAFQFSELISFLFSVLSTILASKSHHVINFKVWETQQVATEVTL